MDPTGERAIGVEANVLDGRAREPPATPSWSGSGAIDALVNTAGGNVAGATLSPGDSPFSSTPEAWRKVVDLNLLGTVLPTQTFGEAIAEHADSPGSGAIVNVSSMTATRVISRVVGLLDGQGGRRPVHALDGRRAGQAHRGARPRQRHRAGLFRGRPEPRPAPRRRRLADRARRRHHRRTRRPAGSASPRRWPAPSSSCARPPLALSPATVLAIDGGFSAYGGF